jgi:hypothetical protein
MSLRYVKFHPRQDVCEHCGAGLIKGAVELSDGKKYGRDCAARALGRKREDSAMKKQVEALRIVAVRAEQTAAYKGTDRAGWVWIAKGYGGNCGWDSTDAYRLPDGSVVLDINGSQTLGILAERAEDRILGCDWRAGRMLVRMTAEEVNAGYPDGGARWTTKRWAEWQVGKGWRE